MGTELDGKDVSALVAAAMRDVPAVGGTGAVRGAAVAVRRALADRLLDTHANLPASWRRATRTLLPPLEVAPEGLFSWPLPWLRRAAGLLLALLAAGALWNGLALSPNPLAATLFTALTTAGLLELGSLLLRWEAALPRRARKKVPSPAAAREQPAGGGWLKRRLRSSWQARGIAAWLVWKNLRRLLFFWLFLRGNLRLALSCLLGTLCCAALLRDFILGRPVLEHLLSGLHALLERGDFWPLFSSTYGFLGWLACVLLVLAWPRMLNRRLAAARLREAAVRWLESAAPLVERLAAAAMPDGTRQEPRRLAAVGQELFSFARELDAPRGGWLKERLRDLGLESGEEEPEALRWSDALREEYEPLGLLREGDACFVDRLPEYRDGRLARRGVMRKVRV